MSQSDTFTILCIVVGEDVPFYIDIEKSKTVDWLKVLIKEKKSSVFADIDPNCLDLYHVDIADNDELVAKVTGYPLDDSKLPATTALTNVFPATPKADTVYFIVNPSKLHGWQLDTCEILTIGISVFVCVTIADVPLRKSTSCEFAAYVDAVKFFTKTLKICTLEDLMDDSNNTHLHVAPGVVSSPLRPGPLPYLGDQRISVYVQKLDEKRPASQVRQNARSG
jgi:Crinkler effector protein N-terminal domain